MVGRQVGGRYILERRLGEGRDTLWVALDSRLQRRVALRLLASGGPGVKAAARFQHPHVAQVLDHGVEGDTPFVATELLAGEDLASRLRRQGPLSPSALASLLRPVAEALSAAHAAGLAHGNLKPSNLFLAREDSREVVKVLDLGLGGADALPYRSPEQLRGEAVGDAHGDVWSLAVVAYEALTGRVPFSEEVLEGLRKRGTRPQAEPPSSARPGPGPEVDAFFARALEVEPSGRFQSARELASAFPAQVDAPRPTRPAKVLIVDDEPSVEPLMRQRFRKQLRQSVYEFVFAGDGEEALQRLREHPDTDVVFSDINMPRMDGLTFLSQVGEVNPVVKVVMVSAYSDLGNLRVAMNRGAFDFIVKPFDFEDLETALTRALRHVAEVRQKLAVVSGEELLRTLVRTGILERSAPPHPASG